MRELLKCPFCGGEADIDIDEYYTNSGSVDVYTPFCPNCQCTIGDFTNKESAIETWNRRVSAE